MPTIFVPSQQPTIAAAMSVAAPGDVIQLQPGYTGETATITVNSLMVIGDGSNVGISLTLAAGINDLGLGGSSPIDVTGNGSSNTLIGNAGSNLLNGAGGVDTVSYSGSAQGVTVDLYVGGAIDGGATDTLMNFENVVGSGFNDVIAGNTASNVLDGGGGTDTVNYFGSAHGVTVDLSSGAVDGAAFDTLLNFENVDGSVFSDVINGNAGSNVLNGSFGDDWLYGGGDADTFLGGFGNDALNGGVGADSMSGGAGNDGLFGGDGADVLNGDAGDDYIVGGNGANTMSGGDGADSLNDGPGNGILSGGAGNDGLFGGDGNDTLSGGNDADYLVGGNGDNALYGDAGNDSLNDGDGNGYLVGGAGDDGMFGGGGADQFFSGAGIDFMVGGAGGDTFVFTPGDGADTIADFNVLEDRINLGAIPGVETFADVQARTSFNGINTIVDLGGGDMITIMNVRPETLTGEQFYI